MNRAEASRINGANSQGPATDEGKAKASLNATKHGLSSQQIVLAHESQVEWDAYLAGYQKTYRPEGPCEGDLVLEIATARWRLRRIASMERALIDTRINEAFKALEAAGEDPSAAQAVAYSSLAENGKALGTLHRYASRLRREYEKATRELELLQGQRSNKEEHTEAATVQPKLQNEPEQAHRAVASYHALSPISKQQSMKSERALEPGHITRDSTDNA